jgi:hypothetical protein
MKGEFMAKRKDTTTASDQTTRGSATPAADTVEQRLVAFAEQLGRIIGTVQARADGWLDRRALDEELTRIRDGAADLLDHVGSGAAASSVAATPGQRQKKDHTPGRSAKTTAGRRATAETGRSGGTTAATGRSGGKVDAPGKSHRRPPAGGRGIKHSDEMIPKLKAAQAMRRRRHG